MEYLMLLCSCGNKTRIPASAMGKSVVCASCAQGVTATPLNTVPIPAAPPQAPPAPSSARPPATRLPMLDQLRGYAIFGMILVNYLGHFDVMPWAFRHHKTGFSYADTIAPLFIFLVGMGFRMSFQRRAVEKGLCGARRDALRRYQPVAKG
ncbi:MAG TPA: heparan-alpha-glucosaminide N-acetyltransferase domain-containing protein [Candidatus Hydrogenedentes bacterium]|nr:heparan-alpha-glucosaminide N-acetyltransferase domain-containing protein [Candidatus Hydrogenedentota bacterium]